jgi:hypothetical protein
MQTTTVIYPLDPNHLGGEREAFEMMIEERRLQPGERGNMRSIGLGYIGLTVYSEMSLTVCSEMILTVYSEMILTVYSG